MILSQGLLISLGFTLIIGVLLFIFIRQKTSSIEHKVDVLFQLVQDEAAKQHRNQINSEIPSGPSGSINQTEIIKDNSLGPPTPPEDRSELIEVSDDSDSDSDSDGSSITTSSKSSNTTDESDEESDDENMDEIKEIHIGGNNQEIITNELEDEEVQIEELNDTEEDADDESNSSNSENSKKMMELFEPVPQELNYQKMRVNELRDMVLQHNLHEDPKKLKKNELVELIENSKKTETINLTKTNEDIIENDSDEISDLEDLNEENLNEVD